MSVQISYLRSLQLNLLVQVSSLLSDNIQFQYLVLDDGLTLFQGTVDSGDLILDLFNLFLGIFDHLVTFLDLFFEVVGELLLFGLLEVVEEELLSLLEKAGLLVADGGHGGK